MMCAFVKESSRLRIDKGNPAKICVRTSWNWCCPVKAPPLMGDVFLFFVYLTFGVLYTLICY